MLLAQRRKRQEVAGKVNHPEYVYRLDGDGHQWQDPAKARVQENYGRALPFNRDRQGRPPPFAVDDDDYGNGRNRERVGNARPPGFAAYDAQPGHAHATPPPNNRYPSQDPLRGGPGGGDGGGGRAPSAGVVYVPTLPQLPTPSGYLPGPLPSVYRPKPPLVFGRGGLNGAEAGGEPHHRMPPLRGEAVNVYVPSGPTIELSPVTSFAHGGGGGGGGQRPYTSPSLPAIHLHEGGRGDGAATPPTTRESSNRVFGIAADGLSEREERLREKLAARRRTQEVQEENARQIAEHERRKLEEKAREAAEVQREEERLRQEREARARREQLEMEKEEHERQVKMMGPKAAQDLLAQQQAQQTQKDTTEGHAKEERARKQARERSNRGSPAAEPAAASPAPAPTAPATNEAPTRPSPPLPPLATPAPWAPWLQTPAQPPAKPQPSDGLYYASLSPQPFNLGSGVTASPSSAAPAPSSGLDSVAFMNAPYTYETENLKRELREISANQRHLEHLLEERLLSGGEHRGKGFGSSLTTRPRTGAPLAPLSTSTFGKGGRSLEPLANSPHRQLEEGVVWKHSPLRDKDERTPRHKPSAQGSFTPKQQPSPNPWTRALDGAGAPAPFGDNVFSLPPPQQSAFPGTVTVNRGDREGFADRDLTLSTHLVYAGGSGISTPKKHTPENSNRGSGG